jgi:hypothetical protein
MSTTYQLGQDISWRILRLQIIIALEFKTSGHYRCREYQLKWERLVHVQTCRSRLHLLLRKPMVLRPNSVAFQLVGEAYVHGRMHVEAMTGVKAGKCSMPVLEII